MLLQLRLRDKKRVKTSRILRANPMLDKQIFSLNERRRTQNTKL